MEEQLEKLLLNSPVLLPGWIIDTLLDSADEETLLTLSELCAKQHLGKLKDPFFRIVQTEPENIQPLADVAKRLIFEKKLKPSSLAPTRYTAELLLHIVQSPWNLTGEQLKEIITLLETDLQQFLVFQELLGLSTILKNMDKTTLMNLFCAQADQLEIETVSQTVGFHLFINRCDEQNLTTVLATTAKLENFQKPHIALLLEAVDPQSSPFKVQRALEQTWGSAGQRMYNIQRNLIFKTVLLQNKNLSEHIKQKIETLVSAEELTGVSICGSSEPGVGITLRTWGELIELLDKTKQQKHNMLAVEVLTHDSLWATNYRGLAKEQIVETVKKFPEIGTPLLIQAGTQHDKDFTGSLVENISYIEWVVLVSWTDVYWSQDHLGKEHRKTFLIKALKGCENIDEHMLNLLDVELKQLEPKNLPINLYYKLLNTVATQANSSPGAAAWKIYSKLLKVLPADEREGKMFFMFADKLQNNTNMTVEQILALVEKT